MSALSGWYTDHNVLVSRVRDDILPACTKLRDAGPVRDKGLSH